MTHKSEVNMIESEIHNKLIMNWNNESIRKRKQQSVLSILGNVPDLAVVLKRGFRFSEIGKL